MKLGCYYLDRCLKTTKLHPATNMCKHNRSTPQPPLGAAIRSATKPNRVFSLRRSLATPDNAQSPEFRHLGSTVLSLVVLLGGHRTVPRECHRFFRIQFPIGCRRDGKSSQAVAALHQRKNENEKNFIHNKRKHMNLNTT